MCAVRRNKKQKNSLPLSSEKHSSPSVRRRNTTAVAAAAASAAATAAAAAAATATSATAAATTTTTTTNYYCYYYCYYCCCCYCCYVEMWRAKTKPFTEIDFDPRLQGPFSCIISGPTGCGKSRLVDLFLSDVKNLVTPPVEKVFYHYGEWQPLFEKM